MVVEQKKWTKTEGWLTIIDRQLSEKAMLVFVFGGRKILENSEHFETIRAFYPQAHILLNSTSGEIYNTDVLSDSLIVTAVFFEHTHLKLASINISEVESSCEAGRYLAKELIDDKLTNLFVVSDGQRVNGSMLVKGFNKENPNKIPVTGGLAGDGANFEKTLVGIDKAPEEGEIVAIGFYGSRLKIGHGSMGGWSPFGPERYITRSKSNVLYELDGQNALELYKKYLGKMADGLPGTALLFPLSVRLSDESQSVVRTILSIDEEKQSMTFAGDVPEGKRARLMKANFDRLIDGATVAASDSIKIGEKNPDLAILISCIGRRLVLSQRTEEEVEVVREILGEQAVITGFYSYGEISPLLPESHCDLLNQTMTITTFSEV